MLGVSICFLDRPPDRMAVRMPTPLNQRFNDVHCSINYIFGCLSVELAMDSMEHTINW